MQKTAEKLTAPLFQNFSEFYRREKFVFLFLPALVIVIVFFFVPIFTLLRISFYKSTPFAVYEEGFTFANYIKIFTDFFYLKTIFFTLKIATIVTFISLACGYPVAYYTARAAGLRKLICILCIIIPLWTNLIVRIYGWRVILGRAGVINIFLLKVGVIQEPLPLVFNSFAVIIGLLNVVFPWVILILFSLLEGLDWSLIEAARDLGAGRIRSFYEVTFKLSLPGVIVAGLFAFIWAAGEYATPSLLGSSAQRTISMEVADQILSLLNWPLGAALAFVLLFLSGVILLLSNKISQIGMKYE